MLPID